MTDKSSVGKKETPPLWYTDNLNLIDKIPVGISVATLQGDILEVNSSLLHVFGYDSKEDFIARKADFHWMDPKKDRTKFVGILKKEGRVDFFRAPFKKKDGSIMWGSVNAVLESTDDGPLLFSSYHDVTEHMLAEEKLQAMGDIVKAMPSGLFIYQFEPPDQLILIDGNPATEALAGIKIAEWRGREFNEIWPKAEESGVTKAFLSVMKTKEMFETEDLYYKDNRLEGAFNVRVFPMPGNRLGVAFENITKRKHVEDALRESEQRFREMADNVGEVFWLFDWDEQRVIYVSPAYQEIWGRNIQDLYDRYEEWEESIHPDDLSHAKESFNRIFETGRGDAREYRIVKPDGTIRWILDRGFVIRGHDNGVQRIVGIAQDITERKEAEEALKEKEAELRLKAQSLEDVNTTLRVLLKERESDKADLEEKVLSNVKDLVLPYIEKIRKTSLDSNQMSCIDILASNLEEIVSPFAHKLSSRFIGLTPAEIRVANLVKEGKATKEIAEFLHLSPKTVEFHRDNIRKKLGIKKSKTNLRTYLLSM